MIPIHLISASDLGVVSPILMAVVTAMAVLLADLLMPPARRALLPWIAFGGLAAAFLLLQVTGPHAEPVTAMHGLLRFDHTSHLAACVIVAASAFLILLSPRFLRDHAIPEGEYYSLMVFAAAAMMALSASNELLTLFVNIELLSITLYILAGIERDNLRSTEASFKYFLTGSYAAAFLLFGLTMVYGAVGETGFDEIRAALAGGKIAHPMFMAAGLGFMLAGFGFKLTLAPFHMYAPDLYAGAPTPVAAAIATGAKVAALAAFLNLFRVFFAWKDMPGGVYHALYVVTVLSILVGNVGAILQPNIKRMLAYSGVSHAGYAMVPLVGALALLRGPAPEAEAILGRAREAVTYYLLAYALMTSVAFGVAATLGPQGDTKIDRYAGLSRRSPILAAVMALALLSLTGVPLTVGFVGKFQLFSVAIKAQLYILAALGVLASVASAYYYLRVIVKMYMEEPAAGAEAPEAVGANTWALVCGAAAILGFAIFPMIYLAG